MILRVIEGCPEIPSGEQGPVGRGEDLTCWIYDESD